MDGGGDGVVAEGRSWMVSWSEVEDADYHNIIISCVVIMDVHNGHLLSSGASSGHGSLSVISFDD